MIRTLLFLSSFVLISACSNDSDNTTTNSKSSQSKASVIHLKLAHGWPKGYPAFGESVDQYKELVESMSNGQIQIKVDSATRHKSAFGIFDFVKSGQYDIGQSASYYYGGKDPDTLFFASMPLDMTTQEQYSWFYHGGGLELANEVYEKHNIEVSLGGNTGMQMGGWFRKEINSVEDLKGLKMRIPGFAGKVVAGVGVIPTNIPTGELYQALERGTIDALEWVAPGLDLRMGFHKIAPYYYTGWHEPGTELMYFFNKDTMEKLPDWATAILRNAAQLISYSMTTHVFALNSDNWDTIVKQYPNVQVKEFPSEVIQALYESNKALLEQESKRSDLAKRIIDSRRNYLKKARAWTTIGSKAYLDTVQGLDISSDSITAE